MSESQRISPVKQREIYEFYKANPAAKTEDAARELKCSKDTIRKYRGVVNSSDGTVRNGIQESDEIEGENRTISLPRTRISTLEELVEYCKIDTEIWEIERWVCNKWEVGAKNDEGKIEVEPLFQVKAFLKKRLWVEEANRIIDRLRIKAERYAPKYPVIKSISSNSGNIVELSPVDVHFGALIWGKETGGADWDLKIAEKAYKDAVASLVSRTDAFKPEKALLVLGHDQQNADNRAGMTEAGTPQNNDGRYQKVADVSCDCSIWAIDLCLKRYGSVEVKMVPGNHDALTTWHLGRVLAAWYKGNKNVVIDNSPNPRKYWEYGVNMLLMTHGNKGKLERYPGVMAAEQRAMWGRTQHHEAHTGDKHQKRQIELDGAIVRILSSLRPPCSWSAENMYIGSMRAAEAFVWNRSEGMVGTACFSILEGEK